MKRTAQLAILFLTTIPCLAQEATITDAKRELSAAKRELDKVVVFRPTEEGGGAFLKSEYKALKHQRHLERKAEAKGLSNNHHYWK